MNKKTMLASAGLVAGGILYTASASAVVMFDQNVTPDVIFGSGNANGGFTVDQSAGIELGLRAKLRHNAAGQPENTFNSNGDGTYSFDAGVAPTQASPTAVWSFEWTINSDFRYIDDPQIPVIPLSAYLYELSIDSDPSQGTSFTSFDPINGVAANCGAVSWDHALGNNGTANGAGVVEGGAPGCDSVDYMEALDQFNVAQNSWKPHWFIGNLGFDPTVDGTYDFVLRAFSPAVPGVDVPDTPQIQLAQTSIQVIVGQGGAPVPVPATAFLLLAGLVGFGLKRRRG